MEALFRNRKPKFLFWYLLLFACSIRICSTAHKALFSNSQDNDVFPRPGLDQETETPGRKKMSSSVQGGRTHDGEGRQVLTITASTTATTPLASLKETLLALPDTEPPPAQGGVILFQHVVKTGGTTIRDNFGNRTKFPNVEYLTVYASSGFQKLKSILDKRLAEPKSNTALFVEIHGRNTPTLVELAPILEEWKQRAKVNNIPFFSFTLLRDPVDFAISFFSHFHVFGDKRFGPNMPGTVENLRRHLPVNPQCLYLFRGERAYFRPRKLYNVTAQDCRQIQTLLQQVMDWVGDTKNLSQDTLPLLAYWTTGRASWASLIEASNVSGGRKQKQPPLSKKDVDQDTISMIRSFATIDQWMYERAVTTNKLKELVVGMPKQ